MLQLYFFSLQTAPTMVPEPQVKGYIKDSVILTFDKASEENGDLSYYYLVVVPQNIASQKNPQDFKEEEVCDFFISLFLINLVNAGFRER